MCVCVRLNVVIQKRLSLCSDILGSISVAWGVNWSCHSSSRQAWWSRGMFRGLGVGVGGSSCFNCLRSLANSLGLECVWPLLSLLHTPALCASPSVEQLVGRFSLRIFRNRAKYCESSVTVSALLFISRLSHSVFHSFRGVFLWLTDPFDSQLSVWCRVSLHMDLKEWKLSKFNSLYVLCVKFQFNILMFFSRISVHVTLDIKANAGRPLAQILQCYKMLFSCHITAKINTYPCKLKLFPFLGGLNKSAKSGAPEFCMWNFISGKADFFSDSSHWTPNINSLKWPY